MTRGHFLWMTATRRPKIADSSISLATSEPNPFIWVETVGQDFPATSCESKNRLYQGIIQGKGDSQSGTNSSWIPITCFPRFFLAPEALSVHHLSPCYPKSLGQHGRAGALPFSQTVPFSLKWRCAALGKWTNNFMLRQDKDQRALV